MTAEKRGRGRPRTEDEKFERAQYYLRPGDLARIRAAAKRRGVPTGSEVRDALTALLVVLDEPGPMGRAAKAALRVELGIDQVAVDESSRGGRPGRPRGPATGPDGSERTTELLGAS